MSDLPDMQYTLVASDGALWLVLLVQVSGPATVVSRWSSKADAEKDATRWMLLAAESA